MLHPELAFALGADRFLREVETVAGLAHPRIVPLFDSGDPMLDPLKRDARFGSILTKAGMRACPA